MILNIDRVLQLLSEGKSIEKIAELAKVDKGDVISIIEEARKLLLEKSPEKTRKKIIIKKKTIVTEKNNDNPEIKEVFDGAELTYVPYSSYLLMYTDGSSNGNPGDAGIGIVIYDKDDRLVGKVSSYIGIQTNNYAEYIALIRALKIAIYFKTKELKIRTDSELAVKQIKGEYKITNKNLLPLYEEFMQLKKKINNFKIEYVPRTMNEKADYLSRTASLKGKNKLK